MKKIFNLSFCLVMLFLITSCTFGPTKCVHEASEWIIDKKATCKIEGTRHKVCTICHKILEEETYILSNHQYELLKASESTANKEAYIDYRCIYCDYTKTQIIDNWSDLQIDVDTIRVCDRAFEGCSSLINIELPNSVTSIGDNAFWECSNLENVYYKGTIEDWCKISFKGLISNPMYYANNIYMLDENNEYEEVTEIVISETITEIGDYQFSGFKNVASIEIPNSVTSIGESAFYDCSSLTSIALPFVGNGIYEIHFKYIFGMVPASLKEVIITGGTSIGYEAFNGCSNLTSIVIPNSVISIGDRAFLGCTSLTNIVIPNSVTSIGWYAFYYCSSLENAYYKGTIEDWCKISFSDKVSNPASHASHIYMLNENNEYEEVTEIVIPETITKIGDYQFYKFREVTSIEIPSSIVKIRQDAFYKCSNLENVYYKGTIEDWCRISFSDFYSNPMPSASHIYMLDEKSEYEEVTEIVIPETITKIGNYQFCVFDNVTIITIPNSVTSIGESAFSGCSNLENVYYKGTIEDWCKISFSEDSNLMTYASHIYMLNENSEYEEVTEIVIPETITEIGEYQFCDFKSITSITIPNSVTYIGWNAFRGCSNLTIYCEADSEPNGWDFFWNYDDRPVVWGYKIKRM